MRGVRAIGVAGFVLDNDARRRLRRDAVFVDGEIHDFASPRASATIASMILPVGPSIAAFVSESSQTL